MPTQDNRNHSVDRRSFLATSAVGAVAVTGATSTIAKATGDTVATTVLKEGTALGNGWSITSVESVEAGALRVVASLADSERVANISVCRSEAGSGALASTGSVDLFLMNNGADGQQLTPADEVQAVNGLATLLGGAEESIPGASRLMGRQERQRAFDPIDHLNPLEPVNG